MMRAIKEATVAQIESHFNKFHRYLQFQARRDDLESLRWIRLPT